MSEQLPPYFVPGAVHFFNDRAQAMGYRSGNITPQFRKSEAVRFDVPFWVKGVEKDDFAIFAHLLDEYGVYEDDYIVLSNGQFQSEIAPSILVAQEPKRFITPTLAHKLSTIPLEELVNFSSDEIDMERLVGISRDLYPR